MNNLQKQLATRLTSHDKKLACHEPLLEKHPSLSAAIAKTVLTHIEKKAFADAREVIVESCEFGHIDSKLSKKWLSLLDAKNENRLAAVLRSEIDKFTKSS